MKKILIVMVIAVLAISSVVWAGQPNQSCPEPCTETCCDSCGGTCK